MRSAAGQKLALNAQAQPAPTTPAPAPAPAPVPAPEPAPAPEATAPVDEPAPAAEPAPEEAPVTEAASNPNADQLTDEELAALAEAEAGTEGEVIVITGSAIGRRELTTPAPVSVVDKDDINAAGMTSIGDVLQNLPAQSNAINVNFNNGGDGSTRVDLRGLGADRTLVLLNGRRMVPGGVGADASVDLNSIPISIIERVEVLKDGASAVYGSDALGGVVNIITRSDFEGADANAYTGVTQRGDGFMYDVNFTTGAKYKKGNVVFSADYSEQHDVFSGDREFSKSDLSYDFASNTESKDGSGTTPSGTINLSGLQNAIGSDALRTLITQCGSSNCIRNEDGTWRRFKSTGEGNDRYNFAPENYLVTPQQRYSLFSSGDYQIHDRVRGFFEGLYTNRTSDQTLASTPLVLSQAGPAGTVLSKNNAFNDYGVDLSEVNLRMTEAGRRTSSQDVNTFRMVAGLDGDLPMLNDWKWDVSFNYGRTNAINTNVGNFNVIKLANALGPSIDKNTCGTPGNPIAGCVPLDILHGAKGVTPEMVNYISFTGIDQGFNEQRTLAANARGRLAKLPGGGDIALAVGTDYRQESGGFTPDPLTVAGDTTGNVQLATEGKYDVKEGFAELSILPFTDKPYAKWLEIDGAARVFDYSSFGSGATWKVGGLWTIPQGVSVRGTFSTAFRAPNVSELFSGAVDDFESESDPCVPSSPGKWATPEIEANCKQQIPGLPSDFEYPFSQVRATGGGNKNLHKETANTFTAGVVYEPPFAKGLSLTLDYFNIDIKDAIQREGAGIIMASCYQYGIESECAKIRRNEQTKFIENIDDVEKNIGGNSTDGIDLAVAYDHERPFGHFRHSLEGTWLHSYKAVFPGPTVEGVGVYDLGVYPRVKANLTTIWGLKGYNAGFNVRYVNAYKECDLDNCQIAGAFSRKVDMNITSDLFLGYSVKWSGGQTGLTVGVNNVTDQDPPLIYAGSYGNSDGSTYDFLGRFFYSRLSHTF